MVGHPMQIDLPTGTAWHIEKAPPKLSLRAQLPGARVFDLCAQSLRAAKASGVSPSDRFALALPASWLVNSPAVSKVLRRWALPPQREAWLALVELLEAGPGEWTAEPGEVEAIPLVVTSLGDEPYVVEAMSKVLALLVPDVVPLMPEPARVFVLGDEAKTMAPGKVFARMVEWFAGAASAHAPELTRLAREHTEVELTGAQALDRLLWFDSEGHRHFPPVA